MKDLLFLAGFLISVPVGTLIASLSRKIRDLVFVVLVFGTTMPDLVDINLVGREWYRGTTRGIEVSFLDLLALILLFSTLLDRQRRALRLFWPAGLGLMLVYFFYCGLSVLLADPHLFGLFELSKVFRGIVVILAVAYFVQSERELKLLLVALAAAIGYEAFICLEQRYLFHGYRIAGTLPHPNSLSMYCCILMPLFTAAALAHVATRLRVLWALAALLAAGCTLLSISRMGFATLVLVSLLTLAATLNVRAGRTNMIVIVAIAIAMAGMTYKAWDSLAGRYSNTSIEGELGHEDEGRGVYLRLAGLIAQDRFFGVGLNNWSYWVTQQYATEIGLKYRPYSGTNEAPDQTVPSGSHSDRAQAAPAHNLAALTLGELGWPGLLLFTALWVRWLSMGAVFLVKRAPTLVSRFCTGAFFALAAALLQSLTEWAYRQTPIFFLINIILGALAAVYAQRRSPIPAMIPETAPLPRPPQAKRRRRSQTRP